MCKLAKLICYMLLLGFKQISNQDIQFPKDTEKYNCDTLQNGCLLDSGLFSQQEFHKFLTYVQVTSKLLYCQIQCDSDIFILTKSDSDRSCFYSNPALNLKLKSQTALTTLDSLVCLPSQHIFDAIKRMPCQHVKFVQRITHKVSLTCCRLA